MYKIIRLRQVKPHLPAWSHVVVKDFYCNSLTMASHWCSDMYSGTIYNSLDEATNVIKEIRKTQPQHVYAIFIMFDR